MKQLSPLAMYYASDWDEDMAGAVGHGGREANVEEVD